jgi:hypothetical protein
MLTWNRVTEAERLPGFWYFRSGGAQFIVPVRAFPTAESLADFVRITEERIPASAWRDQ